MAQGVTSNRYVGGQVGGQPAGGTPPFTKGDTPGTHRNAIKRGRGGSTKKRRPKVKR